MTRFEPDPEALKILKEKVVVLTGGSTGIGAATVQLLHSAGAHIVFGDINTEKASALIESLPASTSTPIFVRCEASNYADNVTLFKTAFEKYGRVDHAVANAGLVEVPGWFNAGTSLKDIEKQPSTAVLDVNMNGVLYFANIASVYLSQGNAEKADKSLTLLSSVAGFEESPGLFLYQPSKHAVLGLMRSLRLYAPQTFGLRVNAICPWATTTKMVDPFIKGWQELGLPTNSPQHIAEIIGGLISAGPGMGVKMLKRGEGQGHCGRGLDEAYNASGYAWGESEAEGGVNGRAIYVEGGRGWDIEEGLAYTQTYWLGKGPTERLVQGQKFLGGGSDWHKTK